MTPFASLEIAGKPKKSPRTYFQENRNQRRGCSPDRRLSECLLHTSSVQRSQRDRETPTRGDLPGGDIFLLKISKYICDPAPEGVLEGGCPGGVPPLWLGCCVLARDRYCD